MAVAEPSAVGASTTAPPGPVVVHIRHDDACALAEVLTDPLDVAAPEDRSVRTGLVALVVQLRAGLRGAR